MKNIFLTRRLPTLIAFIIIFSSIWATSLLIRRGVITLGKASQDSSPKNIRIVNITDNSFSVAFSTTDKTKAAISYGKTQNAQTTVYDDRDKLTKTENLYYSHLITVNGLNPKSLYLFSIIIDGKEYSNKSNSYSVSTGPTINSDQSRLNRDQIEINPEQNRLDPVSGGISLSDGKESQDTLVFLKTADSQELAALTNNAGNYSISLNWLRSLDLNRYVLVNESSIINLETVKQNVSSTIKTFYKKGGVIPRITLSQNYDFTSKIMDEKDSSATVSSVLTAPVLSPVQSREVKILYPVENQGLIDQKPSFQGTAQPGTKIKITIESDNIIQTEVTANTNGSWSFRPETALAPGEHIITVETTNNLGILQRITQNFVVYAQGSQIRESATPSGTIISKIPTPTITPTPVPTKIIALVLTPTVTTKPTSIPTRTPTPTKTPTPTAKAGIGGAITPSPSIILNPTISQTLTGSPSNQPTITMAQPGSFIPSTLAISVSIILIIAGAILLFIV